LCDVRRLAKGYVRRPFLAIVSPPPESFRCSFDDDGFLANHSAVTNGIRGSSCEWTSGPLPCEELVLCAGRLADGTSKEGDGACERFSGGKAENELDVLRAGASGGGVLRLGCGDLGIGRRGGDKAVGYI